MLFHGPEYDPWISTVINLTNFYWSGFSETEVGKIYTTHVMEMVTNGEAEGL